MNIEYVKGDATSPIGDGIKIIVHCCNNVGAWGRGFVNALSEKFPLAEQEYREWFRLNPQLELDVAEFSINSEYPLFELGEVQFVKVQEDIYVANLIGQEGILCRDGGVPIRYKAIRKGLYNVLHYIDSNIDQVGSQKNTASIHMPRIGCGLAGGKWERIEPIIDEVFQDTGISITVYDFEDISSNSYVKANV